MADQAADRAAITELIHRNRITIWMRDFDGWADCFVHEPYLVRWGWWRRGGAFYRRGWDEISKRLQVEMLERPEPRPSLAYDTIVENLHIHFAGDDVSWAHFNQQYPAEAVDGGDGPGRTYEFRLFERHAGQWKIASFGFIDSVDAPNAQMLRLGPNGQLQWMSAAARAKLDADDDLMIRAGRLRVRDARTDQKLQAAISWALTIDNTYMSRRASVPIVLEAGEGSPVKVWWIVAEDGAAHFSFGDAAGVRERIATAALVYALSPAQRQVAELIAEGISLAEIAARLGITANTARTHLNRVFDKTGVRTQTALVRVLLTAASPT
jgi:DNA-binding CsgD family transcriptional regulator